MKPDHVAKNHSKFGRKDSAKDLHISSGKTSKTDLTSSRATPKELTTNAVNSVANKLSYKSIQINFDDANEKDKEGAKSGN